MKKFISLTIVAALALLPILNTANAQSSKGPAPVAQKHQAERRDSGKIWKKGGAYRGKGARVSNYRQHKLSAPPKGHRWVHDGNSFLLVATANGMIHSIVTAR